MDYAFLNLEKNLEKKYFGRRLSKSFLHLYTGKTLRNISGVLLSVFSVIFIYELFKHNLAYVLIYFALFHLAYGLTVMLGVKFLNRYDYKTGLQISTLFLVLYYLIFYFATPANWPYLIFLSLLIYLFFHLAYWVPYQVDFAKFTNKKMRARQVSVLSAATMLFGIIGPVLGGFVIARLGFKFLFALVIIVVAFSAVPYSKVPRTRERFTWTISETWKHFFSKKRRKLVLAYMAYGAESIIGLVVWPIFIFNLLKGNYLEVGVISTLIVAFTVILQLILGRHIDLENAKRKFLRWGSLLYGAGWLIKIFISTAFQIFIIGVYHNFTGLFLLTSFDSLSYELAADNGHYVDEFTVLKEMAINIGAGLMALAAIFVSMRFSIQAVFILAALTAILHNLLGSRELTESVSL